MSRYPYADHDAGLVLTNDGNGKFSTTEMTMAQLAAREPALKIAKEILRHANQAGACYYELWEIISAAIEAAMPQLPSLPEAVRIVAMLDLLRRDEGNSVTVLSDDPEADSVERQCAIEVSGDWTAWEEKRFYGESVAAALQAALTAKQAPPEPWKRDDEATWHLLSLTSEGGCVPLETIHGWSDEQCQQAEAWAGAAHLRASDNADVEVPPIPAHVSVHDTLERRAEMQRELDEFMRTPKDCICHRCIREKKLKGPSGMFPLSSERMILCPECGNKRCPKASDHRLACTSSNAAGQPGSVFGGVSIAKQEKAL